ncbi:MAG: hypothetical protein K6F37_00975 [Lachnospiraceae bacterium]|nr:hypothetical protein [Lachnospiraceae bacterium]
MENYKEMLEKQLIELDELMAQVETSLAKKKGVQDYNVHVGKKNNCAQYYLWDKENNKRIYVRKIDLPDLRKVVQKKYENSVLKTLEQQRKSLSLFIKHYDVEKIKYEYIKLPEAKRLMIEPVIESDEEYVEKWLDDKYEGMEIKNGTEFYSDGGVRVRSKSELIIANLLEKYGVPYKYEKPIYLEGYGMVSPDFKCLKVKERKELTWEHFGMMDKEEYANRNIAKINAYIQNGYYEGVNMLMTFETSKVPISSKLVKNMIEQYLI